MYLNIEMEDNLRYYFPLETGLEITQGLFMIYSLYSNLLVECNKLACDILKRGYFTLLNRDTLSLIYKSLTPFEILQLKSVFIYLSYFLISFVTKTSKVISEMIELSTFPISFPLQKLSSLEPNFTNWKLIRM